LTNQGSPSAADIALFEAKLVAAGIAANPTDLVSLSNRECGPKPPVAREGYEPSVERIMF